MHTLLFRDPVQTALWVALPMAHTSQVESRLQTILDKTRNRRTLKRRFSLFAAAYGAIALVPVAMLRPAAQAQSRAAADLANGQAQETLSVQLVGITDATVRGGEWWNIGGKRLPGRPFNTGEWAVGTTTTVQPGQVGRFFAFRLPPAMQNVPVLYDFPDWTLGGLTILTPGRLTIKGSRPVETMRSIQIQSSSDLLIYGAAFPSSLSRTRIRVGRGSGIWQKRMIMKLRLGQIRRKAETIQMRPGQILHLSARNVDTLIPDITLSGKGYAPGRDTRHERWYFLQRFL